MQPSAVPREPIACLATERGTGSRLRVVRRKGETPTIPGWQQGDRLRVVIQYCTRESPPAAGLAYPLRQGCVCSASRCHRGRSKGILCYSTAHRYRMYGGRLGPRRLSHDHTYSDILGYL